MSASISRLTRPAARPTTAGERRRRGRRRSATPPARRARSRLRTSRRWPRPCARPISRASTYHGNVAVAA